MKIKKVLLFDLERVFSGLLNDKISVDIAFKVAKNHVLLKEHLTVIRTAYKPIEGFEDVKKARKKVFEGLGATPLPGGQYHVGPDKQSEVGEKMEEIDKKFSDIIKSQEDYDIEFNAKLEEDADIDLEKFERDELEGKIEASKLVTLLEAGLL